MVTACCTRCLASWHWRSVPSMATTRNLPWDSWTVILAPDSRRIWPTLEPILPMTPPAKAASMSNVMRISSPPPPPPLRGGGPLL